MIEPWVGIVRRVHDDGGKLTVIIPDRHGDAPIDVLPMKGGADIVGVLTEPTVGDRVMVMFTSPDAAPEWLPIAPNVVTTGMIAVEGSDVVLNGPSWGQFPGFDVVKATRVGIPGGMALVSVEGVIINNSGVAQPNGSLVGTVLDGFVPSLTVITSGFRANGVATRLDIMATGLIVYNGNATSCAAGDHVTLDSTYRVES